MALKTGKTVIAAGFDTVWRTRVVAYRIAIIQHLIAGLDQQKIAFRTADLGNIQSSEFRQVGFGQGPFLIGIPVGLRPKRLTQQPVGMHRRIDQDGFPAIFFGQIGRIKAPERTAYQRDRV